MKIDIEEYNPAWQHKFAEINNGLSSILGFIDPVIAHIGSTSVEGLAAKPIIDILVGLGNEEDLDKVIQPMLENGYIYFEVYNGVMPYRRFFIKLTVPAQNLQAPNIIKKEADITQALNEHTYRLAHVHVLRYGSEHWVRHIAFRDYLRAHAPVVKAYQQLKLRLSAMDWKDGNHYNGAKNDFIKTEERNAIAWYNRKAQGK